MSGHGFIAVEINSVTMKLVEKWQRWESAQYKPKP